MGKEKKKPEAPAGAPAWMATFADMMSLLLCFFILILSFSDVNQKKFKQVTATLRMAFGAQRTDPFTQFPIANSLTMSNFSSAEDALIKMEHPKVMFDMEVPEIEVILQAAKEKEEKEQHERALANLETVRAELAEDIQAGRLEVVAQKGSVIIRINDVVSFDSGSDRIQGNFVPTLERVSSALQKIKGDIDVSGHTDNLPISTPRFRNNWDLSAARAATLGNILLEKSKLDPRRLVIKGHAATRPLVPNTTPQNRAKNRRVEIMIKAESTWERLPAATAQEEMMQPEMNQAFDIDQILNKKGAQ